MPASLTHADAHVKRTARIAGLFYLLIVVSGPFVLMYVPGKLFAPGDASATAANILAHQGLLEAHIAVGVMSELCFIATVLALYELLKGVDKRLAAIMVIVVLVQTPLAFLGSANEAAMLEFLRNPRFLGVFDQAQRAAVTTMLLEFDRAGILVREFFWGLWLLPLAVLVYHCGFIPRFLGVWLAINGVTYIALAALRLTSPELTGRAFTLATPLLLGEVALMLWLVTIGARSRRPLSQVVAAAT